MRKEALTRRSPRRRSGSQHLVSATFSNKTSRSRSRTNNRGRSRERSFTPKDTSSPPAQDRNSRGAVLSDDEEREIELVRSLSDIDRELDIIRSLSEGGTHDDTLDIQEQFSGSPFSNLSPTSTRDSRDYEETEEDDDDDEEEDDVSFRDNDIFSSHDERDSESMTDEESIDENEKYLDRIMGGSLDDDESCSDDDDTDVDRIIYSMNDEENDEVDEFDYNDNYLDRILDKLSIMDVLGGPREDFSEKEGAHDLRTDSESDVEDDSDDTEELETKLRQAVKKAKKLERKLAEAEKRHISHSVRQQNKIVSLESKLALQQRTFSAELEAEKKSRSSLGESTNEEGTECKERLDSSTESTKAEIQDLKKSATTEADHHSSMENVAANANQSISDLDKMKKMLEAEKERCRDLELSEARAQVLLTAERKRIETMSIVNDSMKEAMRKLSRKAMGRRNAGDDDAEGLRKRLATRDSQIAEIRSMLEKKPNCIDQCLVDSAVPGGAQEDDIFYDIPAPEFEFIVPSAVDFNIRELQTRPFNFFEL